MDKVYVGLSITKELGVYSVKTTTLNTYDMLVELKPHKNIPLAIIFVCVMFDLFHEEPSRYFTLCKMDSMKYINISVGE